MVLNTIGIGLLSFIYLKFRLLSCCAWYQPAVYLFLLDIYELFSRLYVAVISKATCSGWRHGLGTIRLHHDCSFQVEIVKSVVGTVSMVFHT